MLISAPELTIGLVREAMSRSTAANELKGSPVAFTPIRRRASSSPRAWHTTANTMGFAQLMIVKGATRVTHLGYLAVNAGHGDAEEARVHLCQGRVDRRDGSGRHLAHLEVSAFDKALDPGGIALCHGHGFTDQATRQPQTRP